MPRRQSRRLSRKRSRRSSLKRSTSRSRSRGRGQGLRRGSKSSIPIVQNRMMLKTSNNLVAPLQSHIKFKAMMDWSFEILSLDSEQVTVFMNSPYLPFDTGTGNGEIGGNTGSSVTPGAGSVASLNSAGFQNWVGSSAGSQVGLYQNYLVKAVKITCWITTQSVSDTIAFGIACYNPHRAIDTPTSITDFGVLPWSKQWQISSSKGRTKVSMYIPMHKFFGLTKQEYTDTIADYQTATESYTMFGGAQGAYPDVYCYIMMAYQTIDGYDIINPICVTTLLEYYTLCYNPKRQGLYIT